MPVNFRSLQAALTLNKGHIIIFILLLVVVYFFALYQAIFASPADYLHGEYVRIMYIHVPSAWLAIGIYTLMGALNFICLVFAAPRCGISAYALAPIGITFTIICLITGSLWGKPIWGAFWVWDARLTSMLILLILYIGYYIVWDYKQFSIKIAAIVNIIGLVNIPIIKFSVDIWSTLHQKASIIRSQGIAIDSRMFLPLCLMFLASSLLTIILWYFNIKTILNERKIQRLSLNSITLNSTKII